MPPFRILNIFVSLPSDIVSHETGPDRTILVEQHRQDNRGGTTMTEQSEQ
jgi:hypothetical protein